MGEVVLKVLPAEVALDAERRRRFEREARAGAADALAALVPIYPIYHVVADFPLELALKQAVFETLSAIVAGIAVAFLNK